MQTVINWRSYPQNKPKPSDEEGSYYILLKGGKGYYQALANWTTHYDDTELNWWSCEEGIRKYDNVVGFASHENIEHKPTEMCNAKFEEGGYHLTCFKDCGHSGDHYSPEI